MVRTTKRVQRIGNSNGVVLDKHISKILKIQKGDVIELSIKKVLGGSNGK